MTGKILLLTVMLALPAFCSGRDSVSAATALLNSGDYPGGIAMLERLRSADPSAADVTQALGIAYLQNGQDSRAEQAFLEVIGRSPGSLPARYSLAMLYEKQRLYSKAIAQWEQVRLAAASGGLKVLADKHIRQLETLR